MNQYNFYLSIGTIALIYSCNTLKNNHKGSNGYSTISTNYIDKKTLPKDDFFQFSNGNWIKKNEIPASESSWGSFNELEQNNTKKLTKILEDFALNPGLKGSDQFILGNYYASMKNWEKRNQLGLSPIKDDLDRIEKIRSTEELSVLIAEHHILGINSFFSFGVGQDLKNVNSNMCYLGQGGIALPNKNYYLSEDKKEVLNKYKIHVENIFKLMSYTEENAKRAAEDVIHIETELAKSMMSPAELRVPENTYNKTSLNLVQKDFGQFNFRNYLNKIGIPSFDTLVVSQPEFILKVVDVVQNLPLNQIKQYLCWKVIHNYAPHLTKLFDQEHFDFYGKILSGKFQMKPINERAINEITRKDFGEILGKAFVAQYFSSEAQKRINIMVDDLLAVFEQRIEMLDWMSVDTKKQALLKLKSIGRKLGFPEKWEDYSSLAFKNDAYIENLKLESTFSHQKNMLELNRPVDKIKWGMPAHMVNAYYHPLLNEIAFPAGIMQAPFFDEKAEDAVNYGRIGMVIGHEFTHGFDDMGSKFAADGSFTNWWNEQDRMAFEQKTGLLGETFAGFCPIKDHCVNKDLTMGENIADLGGLTLAFYAYKRTQEYKNGGLREGYTPAQRFFIAYAQLWKIKYTDAEMKNRIANDPHSPGMYRVNGPLMNCPEFFDAFNIPSGSNMRNEERKISRIW